MNRITTFCTAIIFLSILSSYSTAQDEFENMFEPITKIGGYGELHYNYSKAGDSKPDKSLDFHRFVVYISHSWSEKWSLLSELELEHNFVKGGQGEWQLEQAFINYYHAPYLSVQAGVLLTASSLINEYHEPVFFLSVERPEYAKYIIPSTWFGNGIGISGFWSGLDYRAVIMEGLDGSMISPSSGIRGARQKGYKANAQELLYNLRLDYTNIPGLRIGGSFITNNSVVTDSTNNRINLWEIHARYRDNGIFAAFEYGNIGYDKGQIKSSTGYYLDFGYDIGKWLGCENPLFPWFRWTDYNTADGVRDLPKIDSKRHHFQKWLTGLTYFANENVVLKVDYGQRERQSDGQKTRLFNLGFGYTFE